MCVYVCVCVCVSVCEGGMLIAYLSFVCVCIYIYICVCVYIYICVCVRVRVYIQCVLLCLYYTYYRVHKLATEDFV